MSIFKRRNEFVLSLFLDNLKKKNTGLKNGYLKKDILD